MDFTFITNFFDAYGQSLIMLVVQGCIIALMLEIAAKKAFDSNIVKAEGDKKNKLMLAKTRVCSIATVITSALAAVAVMKDMPLPGGVYFFSAWFGIVYLVQYFVSMKGIKFIEDKIDAAINKPAKTSKPKTSKKSVKITEGEKLYKKLDDGTIVEV